MKMVSHTSRKRLKTIFKWCILATFVFSFLLFYVMFTYVQSIQKIQVNITKMSIKLVDGWGLDKSRSVSLYVLPQKDTALILEKEVCSQPLLLLIIVCSAVKNTAERTTIRETWGNFSTPDYKLVFLLGTTENAALQENVAEEANAHNDIILENHIDSYYNLTLKSVMLLKYVTSHCDKVDYILKTVDDMFVHVPNLVNLVLKFREKSVKNVLVGELFNNGKPSLNITNKWYSPKFMYEDRVYPPYLAGGGYLMDRTTAMRLYEAALSTPFFHIEDVYITGVCARKANIKPRHNPGFTSFTRPLDPCLYINNANVITSHQVTLENMRHLWLGLYNQTSCGEAATESSKAEPQ